MKAAFERLEHDEAGLASIARAALKRSLDLPGVRVALSRDDIARPDDRFDARARAALVESLARTLIESDAPAAARESLEKLREPRAAVVVTGQQPGFLCAPLYNVCKALTAIRMASELERAWGTPVVPLFWNHSDDHDIAEVHHAFVLNANLDLQRVSLAGLSSGRQPFSRIVIDEERQRLGAARELLATCIPSAPELERAIAMFMPRHGETLARAFTRGLNGLLGAHGLVVFEPDSLRGAASRELAALVASEPLDPLLRGANELRERGYEPAIDPNEAALLFRLDARGRRALRATPDGWRIDGDEVPLTTSALVRAIETAGDEFSAGALLRPLVQDRILPVAVYVGGFGELAYHAELGRVREKSGSPATAFAPRISCTWIDPETRGALSKLELTAAEVFRDRSKLSLEDSAPEPEVLSRIRELGVRVERDLNGLRDALDPIDKGLAQSVKRSAHQARTVIETLREKAERAHQNVSGRGRRQVRRVENTLFPRGEAQERVLGPLAFTARWGTSWIDATLDSVDPFDSRPLVVYLDAQEDPNS